MKLRIELDLDKTGRHPDEVFASVVQIAEALKQNKWLFAGNVFEVGGGRAMVTGEVGEPTVAHTPGPWTSEVPSGSDHFRHMRDIYDERRQLIAEIPNPQKYQSVNEAIANARLIAVAPKLLDACRAIVKYGTKGKLPDGRWAADLCAEAIEAI